MSNFNDSAQLYFAVGIYCLHGKLTMVWNLHWSEFHYAWSHVNSDNEVTSHQSEILPWSEISNQFDFTLGLLYLEVGYSRKKIKQVEDILFWKNSLGFFIFLLYPWKFQTKQLNPWIFHKIVLDPLEIPRPKEKTPWKFHIIFSCSPLEIPLHF